MEIFGIEAKMFILLWAMFILVISVTSRKCDEQQKRIGEVEKTMDKEGI